MEEIFYEFCDKKEIKLGRKELRETKKSTPVLLDAMNYFEIKKLNSGIFVRSYNEEAA